MTYAVIIEPANDGSLSVYVPDLPGCVSCGDTIEEAKERIQEAIELHLDSSRESDDRIPSPSCIAHNVTIREHAEAA